MYWHTKGRCLDESSTEFSHSWRQPTQPTWLITPSSSSTKMVFKVKIATPGAHKKISRLFILQLLTTSYNFLSALWFFQYLPWIISARGGGEQGNGLPPTKSCSWMMTQLWSLILTKFWPHPLFAIREMSLAVFLTLGEAGFTYKAEFPSHELGGSSSSSLAVWWNYPHFIHGAFHFFTSTSSGRHYVK